MDMSTTTITKRDLYVAFLTEEGYQPKPNGDAAIEFKKEGGQFVIVLHEDDPNYFNLVYGVNWKDLSGAERFEALQALNQINQQIKAVKVTLNGSLLSFAIEALLPAPDAFKAVFERSLVILMTAVNHFGQKMNKPA